MKSQRICYLGDDDLGGAAAYLAGVLGHHELHYEHVPSRERPGPGLLSKDYTAYVISDYPAANFSRGEIEQVIERVRAGAGLVMVGGWESFHGRNGEYHRTGFAEALPVEMMGGDDRANCAQPCLVRREMEHPILAGLPFETPPAIGGYNRLRPKAGANVLLSAVHFRAQVVGERFEFKQDEEAPLLIVGAWGEGRTAALATDVAPHWVGGLVDWGDRRLTLGAGEGFVEVGNWYAQLMGNLMTWVSA